MLVLDVSTTELDVVKESVVTMCALPGYCSVAPREVSVALWLK